MPNNEFDDFGCFEIINFDDMYVEQKNPHYRMSMEEIEGIKKDILRELKERISNTNNHIGYCSDFESNNGGSSVHFIYSSSDEDSSEEILSEPSEPSEPSECSFDDPDDDNESVHFIYTEESTEESTDESIDYFEDSIDKNTEESVEVPEDKIPKSNPNEIKVLKPRLKPRRTNKIVKNNKNKVLMIVGLIAMGVAIHF